MDERIVETRHSHEGNHVPINGEIDNDTITQTQGNKMALEEIRPPPIIEKFPPPSPLRRSTRTRKPPEYYQAGFVFNFMFH